MSLKLIGGKENVFVCKMFNVDENRLKEERNVINFHHQQYIYLIRRFVV